MYYLDAWTHGCMDAWLDGYIGLDIGASFRLA